MQTCGASRDNREVGAFETKAHRHMTGDHVDDGGRHEKRRNASRAFGQHFVVHVFNEWQTANTRADQHPNAGGRFIVLGIVSG